MSSSSSANIRTASPKHFIVLDAISRGTTNSDKISRITKLDKVEAELIVNDLHVQRLITLGKKRGLFGKKIDVRINDVGSRLLYEKKQELEQKARDLQGWYYGGNRKMVQSFMNDNRAWIPMMIFSGVLNTLFFVSMMSSMGMAMNPMESALAQGDTGSAAEDTQSAADDRSLGAEDSLGADTMGAVSDGSGEF
jgi:hypothetical protein